MSALKPRSPALLFVVIVFISGSVLAQTPANTQSNYPAKPLRLVVPFPAGGPTDTLARVVAQKLIDVWGQQVVVDNRGGANGIIGQDIVAKAPADGHTMLMQSVAFAINPLLYKLPYRSDKDFLPVSLIASTSLILVTHPSVAARSISELTALAKAKPGQLNYASFGQGSIAHLAGEMFKVRAGISALHVPYKGVPQALADLIAARVQFMFPGISSALPHVDAGRLRALAVTSRERSMLAPTLPTMIEGGITNYEIGSWFGAFLPAGSPDPAVRKLNIEIAAIVVQPDVTQQFRKQGFEAAANSPLQFRDFIRAETRKFSDVIKQSGVKVE